MTSEEEALAIALLLRRTHGDLAPAWIAEQIGRLVLENEMAGVARWRAVAAAWQALHLDTAH